MHIILGIVGIIAALSYYFFVFRRAGQAAGEAIDMAQRVRGKMRRNAFRKKAEGSALACVEDPGTAAAVVLMKIVELGDGNPDAHKEEITRIVREEIGMEDADEVVPFAKWVAEQAVNPSDIIRTYKPIWMDNLSPPQLADFVNMAARVANLNDAPTAEQKEVLRLMRERLLS